MNKPTNPKMVPNDPRPAWDILRHLVRFSLTLAVLILLILTVVAWPLQSLIVDAGLITIAAIAAGIEAWHHVRAHRARYERVVILLPRNTFPHDPDRPDGHQGR
jgi:hypothetical protein